MGWLIVTTGIFLIIANAIIWNPLVPRFCVFIVALAIILIGFIVEMNK